MLELEVPETEAQEEQQQQAGKELLPDVLKSDLAGADSFLLEPNVLVYCLSASGNSVQQALSALTKQVRVQTYLDPGCRDLLLVLSIR